MEALVLAALMVGIALEAGILWLEWQTLRVLADIILRMLKED